VLARGIPFLPFGSFVEKSDHNLTAVLMLVWHPEGFSTPALIQRSSQNRMTWFHHRNSLATTDLISGCSASTEGKKDVYRILSGKLLLKHEDRS
uniref:Secreted protein n=1 Tax=Haemonchus contortus TaxID=6289 RepID=A0A7I4YZA8_HAECO